MGLDLPDPPRDEDTAAMPPDAAQPEWCLRTDGASGPLPCGKEKNHPGPCYFRW